MVKADEAGTPAADLLDRVERRASLQRRRTVSVAAVSALVVVTVGVTTVHEVRRSSAPATISLASVPPPAAASATPVAAGLTGSLCDEPGAAKPPNYLDWPCITSDRVLDPAALTKQALADNPELTAPRIRLIADGGPGKYAVTAYELWDAAHLDTPALLGFDGFDGAAPGESAMPPHDPGIITFGAGAAVFARQPISSIRIQATGRVVAVSSGVASIGVNTSAPSTTLTGLAAGGRTEPGWTAAYPHQPGNPDPEDTRALYAAACAGKHNVGTCGQAPLDTSHSVDAFCQAPTGTPPPRYLDWPCAQAADSTTGHRVAVAEQQALQEFPKVKEPRVRLLADRRPTGTSTVDVTMIELWDAAGNGPVTVWEASATGGAGGDLDVQNHDPALILEGSRVYARSGITSVTFSHDGTSETSPVIGGVAVISPPTTNSDTSWTLTGTAGNGNVIQTIGWQPTDPEPPCDADNATATTCITSG